MILNNSKFNNIVKLYKLEQFILYYKLYNKSKYINSYHGWNHVKNFINSLYLLTLSEELYHDRHCMIAAIFHDMNYVKCDMDNPYYDAVNIQEAIKALNNGIFVVNDNEFHFTNTENKEMLEKLIYYTEYSKNREDFANSVHCLSLDVDTMRDCDHSMPLYKDYPLMVYNLFINEYGITGKLADHNMYDKGLEYLENLKYETKFFKKLWTEQKKSVIENVSNFLKDIDNLYDTSRCENEEISK